MDLLGRRTDVLTPADHGRITVLFILMGKPIRQWNLNLLSRYLVAGPCDPGNPPARKESSSEARTPRIKWTRSDVTAIGWPKGWAKQIV